MINEVKCLAEVDEHRSNGSFVVQCFHPFVQWKHYRNLPSSYLTLHNYSGCTVCHRQRNVLLREFNISSRLNILSYLHCTSYHNSGGERPSHHHKQRAQQNNNDAPSDTIRDAILTCNQKLTWVSLFYRTEPTIKKWKNRKLKSKKTDMLRGIGKQSGESAE